MDEGRDGGHEVPVRSQSVQGVRLKITCPWNRLVLAGMVVSSPHRIKPEIEVQ